MKRLILVRHGESEGNIDVETYFKPDLYDHTIQLTEPGRQQARTCGAIVAGMLKAPYTVFVSPYLRATQTLECMLEELAPPEAIICDGRLREQEWKVFKDKAEYYEKCRRRKARGKLYYRFKNGESGYDVLDRVANFFNQLRLDWLLKNREDHVLIVCHDLVIRCLMLVALDMHPQEFERIWIENCGVVILEADEKLKFVLAAMHRARLTETPSP